MTITNAQLRNFGRAWPHLIAVRQTDWQNLTPEQRATVKAGLDLIGVPVGDPAVWTLTGQMDPGSPVPVADRLFVADDHKLTERAVLTVNAVVAAPANLPAPEVDRDGNPVIDAAYRQAVRAAYKTQVDAEIAARHPEGDGPTAGGVDLSVTRRTG